MQVDESCVAFDHAKVVLGDMGDLSRTYSIFDTGKDLTSSAISNSLIPTDFQQKRKKLIPVARHILVYIWPYMKNWSSLE